MSDYFEINQTNPEQPLQIKNIKMQVKQENEEDDDTDNIKEEIMSDEDSNSNRYSQLGKRAYKKKTKDKVRRWTKDESALYENFIHMYSDIMKNSSSKRNSKIFLLMSKFIVTKTPSQCRSHHQKFYPKLFKVSFELPEGAEYINMPLPLLGIKPKSKKIHKLEKNVKYKQKLKKDNQLPFGGPMNELNQDIMNNINQLYVILQLQQLPQPQNEEELLNQMMNLKMMFSLQQPQMEPNPYMFQDNQQNNINMSMMNNFMQDNHHFRPMNLLEGNQAPENQENFLIQDDKKTFEKMILKLEYMEDRLNLFVRELDLVE